MKTFTNIPEQVQQVLENCSVTTSRRNFLKGGGLLVVSFSAAGTGPLITRASAQTAARQSFPLEAAGNANNVYGFSKWLMETEHLRFAPDVLDRTRNTSIKSRFADHSDFAPE